MKLPHLGELVEKRLKDIGMSKAEFSRRISLTPQGASNLLLRQSLDTSQLHRISQILDYDFFQHLVSSQPTELNMDQARQKLGGGKVCLTIQLDEKQQEDVLKLIFTQ